MVKGEHENPSKTHHCGHLKPLLQRYSAVFLNADPNWYSCHKVYLAPHPPTLLHLFLRAGDVAALRHAYRGPSHWCAPLSGIRMPQQLTIYGTRVTAALITVPRSQVVVLTYHWRGQAATVPNPTPIPGNGSEPLLPGLLPWTLPQESQVTALTLTARAILPLLWSQFPRSWKMVLTDHNCSHASAVPWLTSGDTVVTLTYYPYAVLLLYPAPWDQATTLPCHPELMPLLLPPSPFP